MVPLTCSLDDSVGDTLQKKLDTETVSFTEGQGWKNEFKVEPERQLHSSSFLLL